MSSTLAVRSVTFEDAPGIAAATMPAWYHGDSFWRQMWNVPLSNLITSNAQRLPHNMSTDKRKRFEVVVDTATGEILAHARWLVPEGMENMWPSARGPEAKDEEEAAKLKEMHASADWSPDGRYGHEASPAQQELRERTIAAFEAPYLGKFEIDCERRDFFGSNMEIDFAEVLDWLATNPSHKGRGIASLLVASGLKQADRLNMRVIVTATPAAVNLYQRLGFVPVEEFAKGEGMLVKPESSQFLLDYVMTFMIREPKSGDDHVDQQQQTDKEKSVINASS